MSDPDFRHICPVPPTEWSEGRELNFAPLQERVFRRARFYVAAEAFGGESGEGVRVTFSIEAAALKSKPAAELAEIVAEKTLGAIREAQEAYVSWSSKKKRAQRG